MKILVTGSAGFIGYHLSKALVEEGHQVVGIDNWNHYYDVRLKLDRLKELGIESFKIAMGNNSVQSSISNFKFVRLDLRVENLQCRSMTIDGNMRWLYLL